MSAPTLLRTLVNERHLRTPKAFRTRFLRAAAELAELESDREFAGLDVSERQFCRWLDGARPRPYTCRVLEHMFGTPVEDLLRPVVPAHVPTTPADASSPADGSASPPGGPDLGAPVDIRVFVSGGRTPSTREPGSVVVVDVGPVRVVVAGADPDVAETNASADGCRVYSLTAARQRRSDRTT